MASNDHSLNASCFVRSSTNKGMHSSRKVHPSHEKPKAAFDDGDPAALIIPPVPRSSPWSVHRHFDTVIQACKGIEANEPAATYSAADAIASAMAEDFYGHYTQVFCHGALLALVKWKSGNQVVREAVLCREGLLDTMVLSMMAHPQDHEVQQLGCMIIYELAVTTTSVCCDSARHSSNGGERRKQKQEPEERSFSCDAGSTCEALRLAGAYRAMSLALHAHGGEMWEVAQVALDAMLALTNGLLAHRLPHSNTAFSGDESDIREATESVALFMNTNLKLAKMQERGCALLSRLFSLEEADCCSTTARRSSSSPVFASPKVVQAVAMALARHRLDENLQISACRCLYEYAKYDINLETLVNCAIPMIGLLRGTERRFPDKCGTMCRSILRRLQQQPAEGR